MSIPYSLNPLGHSGEPAPYEDGSEEFPWIIRTPTQLNNIRNASQAYYYALGNNIVYNLGNWTPIPGTAISGLDGRGFTISGLNTPSGTVVGFIGTVDGSGKILKIKDLTINGRFDGSSTGRAGGIVAYIGNGPIVTIDNCVVVSDYIRGKCAGGIVGYVRGTSAIPTNISIRNCTSDLEYLYGASEGGAGILGCIVGMSNATMTACKSYSYLTTNNSSSGGPLGGLANKIANAGSFTIDQCFWEGTIESGADYAGGLIGDSRGTKITDSYAKGVLTSLRDNSIVRMGGGIGFAIDSSSSIRCYVAVQILKTYTGTYSTLKNYAGFVQNSSGSNNYYDINVSGLVADTNMGSAARTTEQMKAGLFPGASNDIWAIDPEINDGYPYLINNPPR